MLRRPPTQISLTAEDIAQYEDNRLARLQQEAVAARQHSLGPSSDAGSTDATQQQQAQSLDPNDELKPLPGDKARVARYGSLSAQAGNAAQGSMSGVRTREERIGIGR